MAEDFRGDMGGLDKESIDRFLAGAPLARLACLKPDGAPYVIPVWYQWDGESMYFVGRERSRWCKYLQNDPRVSIVVDAPHSEADDSGQGEYEIPKVFIEGNAQIVEEPNIGGQWVAVAEDMSRRYLGPNGPTYLVPTLNQPRWLIKVTPTKMRTWQGVGWAKSYWVEGTGGPSYEEVHSQ